VRSERGVSILTLVPVVLVGAALIGLPAHARPDEQLVGVRAAAPLELSVVSEDPYMNLNTFHRTVVEPDSFGFGSTIVSTFQAGRSHRCGASNLGWSVTTDEGSTWADEFLPGTTIHADPPGAWKRASDPVVAYDARHDTWLIVGLGINTCPFSGGDVFVSRSTDGANTFGGPVIVSQGRNTQILDKTWIVCDNHTSSPFFGNCYVEWDDEGHHLRLHMSTSTDGGTTWREANIRRDTRVLGGQPLVQPDGTIIMPIEQCCPTRIDAFISRDGGVSYSGHGTSYSGALAIRNVQASTVRGELAVTIEPPLISADVDATGRIYVTWYDCRFRHSGPDECTQNDVVLSTSIDGRRWSPVVRIPIDKRSSSVDHFLPAIAVDPTTSGTSAHLAVAYYFYPHADCTVATCELSVGFVSSTDGGATWTSHQLAGPFMNTWLPLRGDGYFVGDYFSVSFVHGKAVPVIIMATEGDCQLGEVASCNVWEASATIPLSS
jgi:hypothetical protein